MVKVQYRGTSAPIRSDLGTVKEGQPRSRHNEGGWEVTLVEVRSRHSEGGRGVWTLRGERLEFGEEEAMLEMVMDCSRRRNHVQPGQSLRWH